MNSPKISKGQCVAVEYKGKPLQGRVLKAGKIVEVQVSRTEVLRTPPSSCTPFTLSPAEGPMSRWTIKSFAFGSKGREGFNRSRVVVCLDGSPVLEANDDDSGCGYEYRVLKGAPKDVERMFLLDAAAWHRKASGQPEDATVYASDDMWLFYEWHLRPANIPPEEYCRPLR